MAEFDFSQYDDAYAKIDVSRNDSEEIPSGKYRVSVEKVELTRAKSTGNQMLSWQLRIEEGPYKGRMLFRNNMLMNATNLVFLKKDLATCGLTLAKFSDLPLTGTLDPLLDVKLEVSKVPQKNDPTKSNIYFDRRLTNDLITANHAALEPVFNTAADDLAF